ncbi:MAG: PspC domain-containing protein [Chloroflexi bacterium]|nr:PspC domain-containing protein [Chloroflexota bacterium]
MAGPTDRPPTDRSRLHRSRHERLLLGVCGGLAEYFGVDPTLVRIGFVIGAVFPPTSVFSVLGYLLLAVILPEEGTAHLAGRERARRNLEDLRTELSDLAETVRARVTGEPRERRPSTGPDGAAGAGRSGMGAEGDAAAALPDESVRHTGAAR